MSNKGIGKYFFVSILIFIVIIGAFYHLDQYFSTESSRWLDGGAWGGIIIGAVSASATIFLGLVSYWQNKMQREDNIQAQKALQNQAAFERKQFSIQQQIIIENKYMEEYKNRIFYINDKLLDHNISAEFSSVSRTLIYFDENLSKSEVIKLTLELDNKISSIITFLNHIQNTIVFNKYYISSVDDLVYSTIVARKAIARYGKTYLICEHSSEHINNDDYFKELIELSNDIINKLTSFEVNWINYTNDVLSVFKYIEKLNDLGDMEQFIRNNKESTLELREKIKEWEKIE